ncbi:hypothetical protein, partial [Nevskia sp.]|uniref:hypothetical protein n=1 Tax=Nevskia sp. TaxID=1929292 RepID=UPI0025E744D3
MLDFPICDSELTPGQTDPDASTCDNAGNVCCLGLMGTGARVLARASASNPPCAATIDDAMRRSWMRTKSWNDSTICISSSTPRLRGL